MSTPDLETANRAANHDGADHHDFADRPRAEAMQTALAGDAFYAFLERRAQGPFDQRREAMVRYMDFSLTEAMQHDFGIYRQLDESQGLGVSVWSKPKHLASAMQAQAAKNAFLAAHLGDDCASAYQEIALFMSQQSRSVVSPESWYLSLLAVAPECQGQGLGSSLLTPVLERSDALGIPTYLETFTPRNENFYRRLGYGVVRRVMEPTIDAEYALMLRPAESR